MAAILRLVILGPPGSGKGTIGKLIASSYMLQHISSGDTLRDHVTRGTDIGKAVQSRIDQGQLVPDEMIVQLMLSEIKRTKNEKGWILDGFPRTHAQGEILYANERIDAAIYLNVPFDTIISRVKERWIHQPSGRVYNLSYNPPKVDGKDDVTGEPLIQRIDDQPDTVQERLQHYQRLTEPLIEFYKKKDLLVMFSGTKSDEILPKVKQYINFTLIK